jgi:hypothetical protein
MIFGNDLFDISLYETSHPLAKHTLNRVSTDEIQSMVRRINLYLEHFKIISARQRSSASEAKASILKKIKIMLSTEIDKRLEVVPIRINN